MAFLNFYKDHFKAEIYTSIILLWNMEQKSNFDVGKWIMETFITSYYLGASAIKSLQLMLSPGLSQWG